MVNSGKTGRLPSGLPASGFWFGSLNMFKARFFDTLRGSVGVGRLERPVLRQVLFVARDLMTFPDVPINN